MGRIPDTDPHGEHASEDFDPDEEREGLAGDAEEVSTTDPAPEERLLDNLESIRKYEAEHGENEQDGNDNAV